jgi:hypothetical protein
MDQDRFDRFMDLLRRLENAKIHHQLASYREEAISLIVRVPGQYWEIAFIEDGTVEVERFVSDGTIEQETSLEELIARFSDEEHAASHETSRK